MRPMKKDPMAMMMNLGGMLRKKKKEKELMAYGGHGMMVPGDEKVKIVMKMPGGGMVKNAMRDSMMMGDGGIMKYRAGGKMPMYQNGGGPVMENIDDLFATLDAVDVPEDYTDQEIIDVRGRNRMEAGEPGSKAFTKFGYALDEDENVAQPMEFRVITERGKRHGASTSSGRGYIDFDIENVELGGVNEETGDVIPNRITIPADVFDMIEEGELSMNDLTGALSPYYSRSVKRGVRTRPQIIRGEEPEEEEGTTPPRPRGGKKRRRPQIRLPQIGYRTSPKYEAGRRPLFTPGQLKRVGRGG